MTKYVLDASAFLALINNEEGASKVEKVLPHSIMSSVNVSECVAVLGSIGMLDQEIETIFKDLLSEIISFDMNQAFIAGFLRKETKIKGLSFGDRACIALGKMMKLPVMSADKVWAEIDCGVHVELIR
ncbi:MAG: type II toxin-antitoxin system VapC family toxin [Alphaproteobacteria bacterium]|nr:type II toxin-antitoxin system VapC family toxin [Alphaproteobacteria bacterium]